MNICNESRTPTLPSPFVCKEEGKARFMILNTKLLALVRVRRSDVTGSMDRVGDGKLHVLDGLLNNQSDVAARATQLGASPEAAERQDFAPDSPRGNAICRMVENTHRLLVTCMRPLINTVIS